MPNGAVADAVAHPPTMEHDVSSPLVSFSPPGSDVRHLGVRVDDTIVDVSAAAPRHDPELLVGQVGDATDLVADAEVAARVASLVTAVTAEPVDRALLHSAEEVRIGPPVVAPEKIIGVGLNYRSHAEEQGAKIPRQPMLFTKHPSSVIGPDQPIRLHDGLEQVDFEAELAVVIGTEGRDIPVESALDHVLGYTCLNDVTDRGAQFAERQWVRSKSFDTFCPLGPHLVLAADIPDPEVLRVQLYLNDELMQDGSSAELIFGIRQLINFASQGATLRRGDVIATGTPAGVGFARDPAVFLAPGDRVRIVVEGIGELSNPVVGHGAGGAADGS